MKNDLVERLLPCPFCGTGEPYSYTIFDGEHHICCRKCPHQSPARDCIAEAIIAWNTRISTTPGREEIAEAIWFAVEVLECWPKTGDEVADDLNDSARAASDRLCSILQLLRKEGA